MSSTSKVTIPIRLELEYMVSMRGLHRQLEWFTVASLQKFTERQDSAELAAFLGLSVPEILDEKALRRRLRQIALSISDQKVRELRALLGRSVRPPPPGLLEQWLDDQVIAIQASVTRWLVTANAEIANARTAGVTFAQLPGLLRALRTRLSQQAERRASAATLTLNSTIIEAVAKGAGSTHYRWDTTMDGRQRAWHGALNGTIQSWDSAPAGGGTKEADAGHPGSGYGCRCLPQPLEGRSPTLGLLRAAESRL